MGSRANYQLSPQASDDDPTSTAQSSSAAYEDRLRALAAELSMTEERQRRQIAGALHDGIAQTLAHAQMKLRSIPSSKTIVEVIEMLDDAIARTRSIMADLSPPVLHDMGLPAAIEWLADRFRQRHPIDVSVSDDGVVKPLDEEVSVTLFQAVRELLANVVKHASASHVKIDIRRSQNTISIAVTDDGVGMDRTVFERVPHAKGGFGLFNIRERLKYLGGYVRLADERKSSSSSGVRIEIGAPVRIAGVVEKGE